MIKEKEDQILESESQSSIERYVSALKNTQQNAAKIDTDSPKLIRGILTSKEKESPKNEGNTSPQLIRPNRPAVVMSLGSANSSVPKQGVNSVYQSVPRNGAGKDRAPLYKSGHYKSVKIDVREMDEEQ